MSDVERPWDADKAKPASNTNKIAVVTLVLLFGICGVGMLAGAFDDDDSGSSHDEYGAQVACEQDVAETFKSPGSADFGGIERTPTAGGWRVTGVVDAENSFGASLRHDFSCLAIPGSEEGYWRVTVESVTPR